MTRGKVSLSVHVFYLLFGLGMLIYSFIAAEKHNAQGGGWEGIGIALLLVFGLIIAAAGLVGTILKIIHVCTGWKLLAILVMLLDVAYIFVLISLSLPGGNNISAASPEDFLPIIPFVLLSLASFISNAMSLKN